MNLNREVNTGITKVSCLKQKSSNSFDWKDLNS
jgi:hypothetical protein